MNVVLHTLTTVYLSWVLSRLPMEVLKGERGWQDEAGLFLSVEAAGRAGVGGVRDGVGGAGPSSSSAAEVLVLVALAASVVV